MAIIGIGTRYIRKKIHDPTKEVYKYLKLYSREYCKNLYIDWYKEYIEIDYGSEDNDFLLNCFPELKLKEQYIKKLIQNQLLKIYIEKNKNSTILEAK